MPREHPDHAALADAIRTLLAEMLVPGAVVVWRTPEFAFEEVFGTRDPGAGAAAPVGLTDHFRVGSNTKTVTGTVVLQLVADPQVDLALEDPVSKHYQVPGSTHLDHVTIRHLLEMRSGLANYSDTLSFNERLDDPEHAFDIDELIAEGVRAKPVDVPGGDWHYSNTNTAILGRIVERLDRRELWESFRDRIIEPLKLNGTYLPQGNDRVLPQFHPRGYMFGTNVSTVDTMALSAEDQARARRGELGPNEYTRLTPTWTWAAGGLVSTAPDLATYVRAMVRGGLLPPDLQRERLASVRPTTDADDAPGYGLGLAKFGPMLGHDGTLPGYQSFMGHDPDRDSTLIVLTNLSAAPDGALTANQVARLILR